MRDKAIKIASDPKDDGYQEDWLQWFTSFSIRNLVEVVLLMNQVISSQMNFINQLLKNLKKEKFIQHLKTVFGVLI